MSTISSGAAEFYGAAVAEHLHIKTFLEFCGLDTNSIKLDSSAVKEIANREGVGQVRLLGMRVSWLQQAVRRGLIEL